MPVHESAVLDALRFVDLVGVLANALLGGVVARAEVMNCLTANSISTFGGSPVTTAGALVNLNYLVEHDLQGNARRVGGLLLARLQSVAATSPLVM